MVSQEAYVEALLSRFGLDEVKEATTLHAGDPDYLKLNSGEKCSAGGHSWLRSVVGGVSYLALGSRMYLLVPVALLAEGQAGPAVNHIATAKMLLRYVKNTARRTLRLSLGVFFGPKTVSIRVEFDANFGHERARKGYVCYLGGR